MKVNLDTISINSRKRKLNVSKVADLAESFSLLGQLEPITLASNGNQYTLLAGWHRLEAARRLGWDTIEASLFDGDALECELVEIDENLINNDLTVLEQGEHIQRRNEILEALGQRAKASPGVNQYTEVGETISPTKTTEDVAKEAGLSERSAQQRTQIARDIAPEVKELIRDTPIADSTTQLLELARLKPEEQLGVAKKATVGEITIAEAKKQMALDAAHEAYANQTRQQAQAVPLVEVADCTEWLNRQPACDLLLTDPPYSTDVDNIAAFANWLPAALNKVKSTGRAYVFIGAYPEEIKAYLGLSLPAHIRLEQMLIWTYKNTLGHNPKYGYKQNYQVCLYYIGEDAPELDCPITNEQWAVISENAPDGRLGDRFHTWQKPLGIAEMFVRHSTKVGDVVYDPFTCTGTFLLAAAKLGRIGLGCDISRDNLEIAVERGCAYA